MKLAAQGLYARFQAAEGREPRLVQGSCGNRGTSVYRSWAEVKVDMMNPTYRTDPAFMQSVEQKLARSDI